MRIYNTIDIQPSYIYKTFEEYSLSGQCFFISESASDTGILEDIKRIYPECDIHSESSIWFAINKDPDKFETTEKSNDRYLLYLKQMGVSVEKVRYIAAEYCTKYNSLLRALIYIGSLIWSIVCLVCFKYRKLYYILTAVLSLVMTLDKLSAGMSSVCFYKLLSKLRFENSYVEYMDMQYFFWSSLLEAFMTIAFLDVVLQYIQDSRNSFQSQKLVYSSRWLMITLEKQIDYFLNLDDWQSNIICRQKFEWCTNPIEEDCKVREKRIAKKLKIQIKYVNRHRGKGQKFLERYKLEAENIVYLTEFLEFTRVNNQEYTVKEYVERFEKARNAMYYLGYGYI